MTIEQIRPPHVSGEVAAAAASTRTEAQARAETESAKILRDFDRWLSQNPDIREFIAESRSPAVTRSFMLRCYMGGNITGFTNGALEAIAGVFSQ